MSYTEIIADGTILGDVPDIRPGTFFRDRQELHDKRLHRGLMRGIASHGSSIVLSGGYVDDEDMGDVIIYTGEGGRDSNTGRQIADQQLALGNRALAENHFTVPKINGTDLTSSSFWNLFVNLLCDLDPHRGFEWANSLLNEGLDVLQGPD